MKLSSMLAKHIGHKVFADNFVTSLPLVLKLKENGQFVGMARLNRLTDCFLTRDKEFEKKGRGAMVH